MTPKISKLFDELEEDLRLTDLQAFANKVAHIRKSLTPIKKTPKACERFKLDVIDGFNTSELYFDSEKQLLSFMELKRKSRIPEIDRFCNSNGISKPIYGRTEQYKRDVEINLNRLKTAGLNLELSITKL